MTITEYLASGDVALVRIGFELLKQDKSMSLSEKETLCNSTHELARMETTRHSFVPVNHWYMYSDNNRSYLSKDRYIILGELE